jgi:hypothetical protein
MELDLMTELEKQLTTQNQLLEEQIHVLKEQVEFMTKKLFGRSSETTPVGQGQSLRITPLFSSTRDN